MCNMLKGKVRFTKRNKHERNSKYIKSEPTYLTLPKQKNPAYINMGLDRVQYLTVLGTRVQINGAKATFHKLSVQNRYVAQYVLKNVNGASWKTV